MPQPPQLAASWLISVQTPLQFAYPELPWPLGQQRPLRHWPSGQALPHPPQLFRSVWVLMQAPSQQVSPAAQQLVPWLPVQSVFSQGQTLHCPLQQ
jgi:hypothetical protein